MKTILVTGGAGFIGSNFVTHLLQHYPDYRVIVLDLLTYAGNLENFPEEVKANPYFSFWHGDVRDAGIVSDLVGQVNIVVHFAAESHVARSIYDNRKFFETDVLGTQTVVNAAAKSALDCFIHISSSEVYGTARYIPMDEEHPLHPQSPYASAKCGADRLVYSYHITYGTPMVIVRPFNTYGPRQHLEKVIPRFITSALLGEPLFIHGGGDATRDWLYVEDHCEALARLLQADMARTNGQTINLGTGQETSVREIARMVLEVTGRRVPIVEVPDRPGQVKRHCASVEKARELLQWHPQTSLYEGLEKTIKWYADNEGWWRRFLWMKQVSYVAADQAFV